MGNSTCKAATEMIINKGIQDKGEGGGKQLISGGKSEADGVSNP